MQISSPIDPEISVHSEQMFFVFFFPLTFFFFFYLDPVSQTQFDFCLLFCVCFCAGLDLFSYHLETFQPFLCSVEASANKL